MVEIFKGGNKFQNLIYEKMSLYNMDRDISEFGKSINGNSFYHILSDENNSKNFLNEEIYEEAMKRCEDTQGIDTKRLKTNTVSSQACCFNLFIPIKKNLNLANYVISKLIGKNITIEKEEDIYLEFIPNEDERLEYKGKSKGLTSADIGIFYRTEESKKGVILIEFKYIENNFSTCENKKRRQLCNNKDFYKNMIERNTENNNTCGYSKYKNWDLTNQSNIIDINKIKNQESCPFKNSLNQLWRNIILSENIKNIRNLDECRFNIICPKENHYLFKGRSKDVMKELENVSADDSKGFVNVNYIEDIVGMVEEFIQNNDCTITEKEWISEFRKRYI